MSNTIREAAESRIYALPGWGCGMFGGGKLLASGFRNPPNLKHVFHLCVAA
ncbi:MULTISPECIES: hypothetical protein [Hyphomicrobiales]|uniref:hypothetical protein n=1 Tax=Hyphomicrobiales TaxID=356 RepID=UPI0013E38311|nr:MULTISPECIES: hypothetical protein [Hyphomicrobiales]MCY1741028.1 hypothetical protein [Ensifer sp. SL37]